MPRKTKEFLRRSAAAKKGWRTRRRNERRRKRHIGPGVAIVFGYVSRNNSFTLLVQINTHRQPISHYTDEQLFTLVESLVEKGHFNSSPHNPHPDLEWTTGNLNYFKVISRDEDIAPGHARLAYFGRGSPDEFGSEE